MQCVWLLCDFCVYGLHGVCGAHRECSLHSIYGAATQPKREHLTSAQRCTTFIQRIPTIAPNYHPLNRLQSTPNPLLHFFLAGADLKCAQVLKIVLGSWATQVYDTMDPW